MSVEQHEAGPFVVHRDAAWPAGAAQPVVYHHRSHAHVPRAGRRRRGLCWARRRAARGRGPFGRIKAAAAEVVVEEAEAEAGVVRAACGD